MKQLIVFLAFIAVHLTATAKSPVRIACVGDSILRGDGLPNRARNNIPVQLQNMLGAGYKVDAITGDDKSIHENTRIAILLFADEARYAPVILQCKAMRSRPRIVIVLPPALPGSDLTARAQRVQRLRDLASQNQADIVDMQPVVSPKGENFMDATHLSPLGATDITRKLYEVVVTTTGSNGTSTPVNFAAIAAPGSEYRSGAGWNPGRDWWAQHGDIDSLLLAQKGLDIVFLGNSITQGTGGHRPIPYKPGFPSFNAAFGNYRWESAGISGDRTQNVYWRLQNGAYREAKPRLIVVTIGVNNFPDNTPEEVATGIKNILDWISKKMPATKVLLIGPLPAGMQPGEMRRIKYEGTHAIISGFSIPNGRYLPLSKTFIRPDGSMNPELVSGDGIHLQAAGYKAWAEAMKPVIEEMLRK